MGASARARAGLEVGQVLGCSTYSGLGLAMPALPFLATQPPCATQVLKGLGHAKLGNFSSDRMVIELTKISK